MVRKDLRPGTQKNTFRLVLRGSHFFARPYGIDHSLQIAQGFQLHGMSCLVRSHEATHVFKGIAADGERQKAIHRLRRMPKIFMDAEPRR